jgi:hypothetical protein
MSDVNAVQPREARDMAALTRHLRGDLRFLRLYTLATRRVMRYKPHPESVSASEDPGAIADRIEAGLAGEARRYRLLGWSILAVIVAPVVLSGILWSGTYWLPVRIYWWPFERGNYGLPFFSLFEWLAFLLVAAYFVVAWALLVASYADTCKLGTEYRRLADATGDTQAGIAEALGDGTHPRALFVAQHAPVFSAYHGAPHAEERR